jgi:hypothetical protein
MQDYGDEVRTKGSKYLLRASSRGQDQADKEKSRKTYIWYAEESADAVGDVMRAKGSPQDDSQDN